jgi:hypothetical protein
MAGATLAGTIGRDRDEATGQDDARHEVALWRLYTLRVGYLVLAGGLGTFYWPSVIRHTTEFAVSNGVQTALLAGLGLTAVLGFRYPVKMLPLLLFEMIWKAVYLAFFALPLWRAGAIPEAMMADVSAVMWVVIFLPLIPWRHVWREFAIGRGERWR